MSAVPGTRGYERSVSRFVEMSQALVFSEICAEIVGYLPEPPAQVLDAGAGAGQNAAAMAELGHTVTAVEPMLDFLKAARSRYAGLPITWVQDSLPFLERFGEEDGQLDFVLVEAVWHHLAPADRMAALTRIASLLRSGGRCAISLRNGPAGQGTHVFPTDAATTIREAARLGFACLFSKENIPSVLPNKTDVVWARLVFEKP